MAQARLSRMETGRRVPNDADIHALCRGYEAPQEVRQRLLAQARELRAGIVPARTVLHRHGGHSMQDRISRIEHASEGVRTFSCAVVTGLLQTPDYARALFSGRYQGDDLDQVVAARLYRQRILDTEFTAHLVLTESALRWHVGSPEVMAQQMEHIAATGERTNVRLGVIPWTRPNVHPVLHPFQIYDQQAVMVGTEIATALHTDTRDVTDYVHRFEIYAGLADYGDAAAATLARVAAEYRAL